MDAILKELSELSDSGLCKELKDAGVPFGGISKSTRKFFEKRLAAKLLKDRGGCVNDSDEKTDNKNDDDESEKSGGSSSIATTVQGVKAKQEPPDSGCREEGPAKRKALETTDTSLQAVPQSSTQNSTASSSVGGIYYVVCIPADDGRTQSEHPVERPATAKISQNKKEVLKLMKENTEARFKTFKSLEEAESFAKLQTNLNSVTTPKKIPNSGSSETVSERANTYRSPKPQQLNALRFAIEKKDEEKFRTLVDSNPRYLVTAVDSPTFLHEGCKYNALHVAAMKNLPGMMRVILDTLDDPRIPRKLYPSDSEESVAARWEFVTHLYLNSPEKGNGETPLHFASKFGYVECVKLLLDHPKCNKRMANKYGQTASQIICNRYKNVDKVKVQATIAELLNDHFFVPVWRAEDDSMPGMVGEPWSPDVPNSQSALLSQQAKESPIESNISLRAMAGPMSPSEADEFHKHWKTPPSSSKKMAAAIRRGDSEKGLERIGRDLAYNRKIPWIEYWSFLDEFVDLSTTEGLELLEEYLAERYRHIGDSPVSDLGEGSHRIASPPTSVMKNLETEFTKISPAKREDSSGESQVENSSKNNIPSSFDSSRSSEELRKVLSGMSTQNSSDTSGSKVQTSCTSAGETDSKSHETSSEVVQNVANLVSKLADVSLHTQGATDKLNSSESKGGKDDGHLGDQGRIMGANEAGDPGKLIKISEGDAQRKKDTHNSKEGEGTLNLATFPLVSPPAKPIKSSTQVSIPLTSGCADLGNESGTGMTVTASASAESTEHQNGKRKVSQRHRSPLFSPVQMITNMMSRLNLAVQGQGPAVMEESDVDTGVSVDKCSDIQNNSRTSDTMNANEAVEGDQTFETSCVLHTSSTSRKDDSRISTSSGDSLEGSSSEDVRTSEIQEQLQRTDSCVQNGENSTKAFEKASSGSAAPNTGARVICACPKTPEGASKEYTCLQSEKEPSDGHHIGSRSNRGIQSRPSDMHGGNVDPCKMQTSVGIAANDEVSNDGNEAESPKRPVEVMSPKTPGVVTSPKTPGEVMSPKTPGEVSSPKTPGEVSSPKTPGEVAGDSASFHTPVNQRIVSSPAGHTPSSSSVFISGVTPTKLDLHVLRAIEKADFGDDFPFIQRWKQAVEGVPEEIRQRWRTPMQMRQHGASSPSNHTPSPHRHPSPSPHRHPSPSPHRHRSPLVGGRSPIIQRLRNWSEPVRTGTGRAMSGGGEMGRDRVKSPNGGGQFSGAKGSGRVPRQNLMSSAYMQ